MAWICLWTDESCVIALCHSHVVMWHLSVGIVSNDVMIFICIVFASGGIAIAVQFCVVVITSIFSNTVIIIVDVVIITTIDINNVTLCTIIISLL